MVERLQITADHARFARRREVRCRVLHEPAGAQNVTSSRQVGQRTFQQAKLVEQVWPRRVGADSRQHHELRRQCFRERRAQRSDHRLGLRKTGRWIENGRQHREGAADTCERRGERRDLVEIGHRDVAATRRPRRALGGIANHGTNRQACVAERARNGAADLPVTPVTANMLVPFLITLWGSGVRRRSVPPRPPIERHATLPRAWFVANVARRDY